LLKIFREVRPTAPTVTGGASRPSTFFGPVTGRPSQGARPVPKKHLRRRAKATRGPEIEPCDNGNGQSGTSLQASPIIFYLTTHGTLDSIHCSYPLDVIVAERR
jgi:hypothetical protein